MLTAFSRAEVYTPRSPRKNQYYRCVEAHFEELEGTWEDHIRTDRNQQHSGHGPGDSCRREGITHILSK